MFKERRKVESYSVEDYIKEKESEKQYEKRRNN
jgi:hypothetical protein